MVVWFEKIICWGLLLVGEHSFMHFPDFCTKKDPTIGVGMFIVIEKPSSTSKVMERTSSHYMDLLRLVRALLS